jgi:hypothetical protein
MRKAQLLQKRSDVPLMKIDAEALGDDALEVHAPILAASPRSIRSLTLGESAKIFSQNPAKREIFRFSSQVRSGTSRVRLRLLTLPTNLPSRTNPHGSGSMRFAPATFIT